MEAERIAGGLIGTEEYVCDDDDDKGVEAEGVAAVNDDDVAVVVAAVVVVACVEVDMGVEEVVPLPL